MNKMFYNILLILIAVIIATFGQITLKIGMTKIGNIVPLLSLKTLLRIITSPYIILPLILYAAGFFLWAVVLTRVQLSMAYPMLALSYAIVPLFSYFIFGETISIMRWLGILFIVIGVLIIVRS